MASERPTWTGKGLESLGELNGGAGKPEDPPKPETPPSPEASSVDAGTPPTEEPPKAPPVGDQQGIRTGSIEDEYGRVHEAEHAVGKVFRPDDKSYWFGRLQSMMKEVPGEKLVDGKNPPATTPDSPPGAQAPAKRLERTKKEQFIEFPKK